jgi:hypothetical protein
MNSCTPRADLLILSNINILIIIMIVIILFTIIMIKRWNPTSRIHANGPSILIVVEKHHPPNAKMMTGVIVTMLSTMIVLLWLT